MLVNNVAIPRVTGTGTFTARGKRLQLLLALKLSDTTVLASTRFGYFLYQALLINHHLS